MGIISENVEMLRGLREVAVVLLFAGAAGCAVLRPTPTPLPPVVTPVVIPTVPPRTPTPEGAKPLPTRPTKNPEAYKAKRAGRAIGSVVTYAGLARADGNGITPTSVDAEGVPTFTNYVGSGFMIVIEGKPGISYLSVGRRISGYDPAHPLRRPDLEIQVNRPLGDGSQAVCDARRPNIGGIPAITPPSFADSEEVAAALHDFSCRFETFVSSAESCTVNEYGDFSFLREDTTQQFCMVVARAWNFPMGDTLVSVRLRDNEGNPGPSARFRLRRSQRPTRTLGPTRTPTPTVSRRRP